MPPICRAQREVLSANMRHEFVHYNNTNQDQQSDSLETRYTANFYRELQWYLQGTYMVFTANPYLQK